jgi:Predicted amidohydrolase
MSREIKVVLGQMKSNVGNVSANIQKAVKYIEMGAKQGGDIICFPELFATGYNFTLLQERTVTLSRRFYSYILDNIAAAARNNHIHVIAPYGIPSIDGMFNGASLFSPDGDLIGQYCKAHAFGQEREYFQNGSEFPVFNTNIGRIGIMICYDAGFPEVARSLCNRGAEIIFVPSAWRMQDEKSWLLNIPSRALENQLFTVGVNQTGMEADLHLCGQSMVCDPWGNTIYRMSCATDHIAIVSIDLEDVQNCRSEGGYLQDIRPGSYMLNES